MAATGLVQRALCSVWRLRTSWPHDLCCYRSLRRAIFGYRPVASSLRKIECAGRAPGSMDSADTIADPGRRKQEMPRKPGRLGRALRSRQSWASLISINIKGGQLMSILECKTESLRGGISELLVGGAGYRRRHLPTWPSDWVGEALLKCFSFQIRMQRVCARRRGPIASANACSIMVNRARRAGRERNH